MTKEKVLNPNNNIQLHQQRIQKKLALIKYYLHIK